jgi:DNA-binding response OmpR family regulator
VKILVVEDDPVLRPGLVDLLGGAGHEVAAVADGTAGVERGVGEPFDLVVLDVMLPGLDGLEVCRRLRTARPALPVLMLTARGAEDEVVRGLRTGADDYVTKPFGARELLARVASLGRRARAAAAEPDVIEADGCTLDLGRCEARRDGRAVSLTPREVGILRWLSGHRGQGVSRAELLERVWGVPGHLHTRAVDMAIMHLRRKVERDPDRPVIVLSVKGVGYAWGPR